MNSPRLSIIVAVYNAQLYIHRCMESLVGQTLQDIEIICIDDGSSDGSLPILREYAAKDSRINVISCANGGLSSARNLGISAASADLLTFVDADDYVDADTYERALAPMEDDVDYVCFGISAQGHKSERLRRLDEKYYAIQYNGKVRVDELVLSHTDVSACNKIFRKSLLEEHGIAFPDGLKYEDTYFFTVYGLRSRQAYYIPEKKYHYIRRADSIMGKTFAGCAEYNADHLLVVERLHQYLVNHGMLHDHLYYFGKLFFSLYHSALHGEPTIEGKQRLAAQAKDFLSRMGLSYTLHKDLVYPYHLVMSGIPVGCVRRNVLGLLSSKQKAQYVKYYFCGIPFMRSRKIPRISCEV